MSCNTIEYTITSLNIIESKYFAYVSIVVILGIQIKSGGLIVETGGLQVLAGGVQIKGGQGLTIESGKLELLNSDFIATKFISHSNTTTESFFTVQSSNLNYVGDAIAGQIDSGNYSLIEKDLIIIANCCRFKV